MGIIDVFRGPKCQMYGRRKSDVFLRTKLGAVLCGNCAKGVRMASGKR